MNEEIWAERELVPRMKHDEFFYGTMVNPQAKKSIAQTAVPLQKLKNFNVDKLITAASMNIDEKLRKKIPDLTLFDYSDPHKIFCLHIEHQSRNDPNIQKRIMDYQIAINKTYRRSFPNDSREIVVTSILFQASKKPYDATQLVVRILDSGGNVCKTFDVFDLAQMSYEELEKIGAGRFVLIPMKYMINDDPTSAYLYIMKNKEQIIKETQDVLIFEMAQNYVLTSLSKDDRMKLIRATAEYDQSVEEDMGTWANSYANEMARNMANEMARKLAQEMANEMARKLAQEMANEMARKLAQEMANEMARKLAQADEMAVKKFEEGKTSGFEEGKFFALRKMLNSGIDLKSAMQCLDISEPELKLHMSSEENSMKLD